jgi:hypothetical protein
MLFDFFQSESIHIYPVVAGVHASNPSYTEGEDREGSSFKANLAKSYQDLPYINQ